jgi:hypothetical protein
MNTRERERREAPRVEVREWAKIIAGDGSAVRNCTISNISATGALLVIGKADPPRSFFLYRKADQSVCEAFFVARRCSQSIAVRLSSPLNPASEQAQALMAAFFRHSKL